MDVNVLMASVLFGAIGMGMVVYGKRSSRIIPALVGVALMIIPYFFTNLILLLVICVALTAIPFVFHD